MTDIINILIRCEFAYHVEFDFIEFDFEVYTGWALNNHITHRITAVFIMKTIREVFIIMRAGKIDKRNHEIAKKPHNFVNL